MKAERQISAMNSIETPDPVATLHTNMQKSKEQLETIANEPEIVDFSLSISNLYGEKS